MSISISTPTPNLPLLRQVLRHIDTHPKEWNQHRWAERDECGTTCCVAGWTCVFAGYEIEWRHYCKFTEYLTNGCCICTKAWQLLGLIEDERAELFAGYATREYIEAVAERIAKRAGEPLWPKPEPGPIPAYEFVAPVVIPDMAVC